MWPRRASLKGCAHAQPEVALYPPYWGLFTRNDVIKSHVNPKRFPWKGEVSACATGCRGFLPIRKHFDQKWGHQSSLVWLPLEVMCLEMPLGCSLGRPSLSFSTPFTGYLPLSRHVHGEHFQWLHFLRLLFSDMLCSTPSSLSRPLCIFVIFSEILTFLDSFL